MTSCVACPDGDGREVPAELGGLTVPFVCGDCRIVAREARVEGQSFTLPVDREEWLSYRERVLSEGAVPEVEA